MPPHPPSKYIDTNVSYIPGVPPWPEGPPYKLEATGGPRTARESWHRGLAVGMFVGESRGSQENQQLNGRKTQPEPRPRAL